MGEVTTKTVYITSDKEEYYSQLGAVVHQFALDAAELLGNRVLQPVTFETVCENILFSADDFKVMLEKYYKMLETTREVKS